MTLEDDVRSIVATPTESTRLDLKESIGWNSLRKRIETARDIVCLANREGGQLLFGIQDLGGGKWNAVGLQEGDDLPDTTELGKVIRSYFDPVPLVSTHEVIVDGLRFGLIRVFEFERLPSVCKAIGNDENNRTVVRPGYIYRRSDTMECAIVDTAGGVQAIIEASAAKTGAVVGAMLRTPPTDEAPRPAPTLGAGSFRFCDLLPEPLASTETIGAILDRIGSSSVMSYGGVGIPSAIRVSSLPPSAIVRETDRVLIERSKEEAYGRAASLIEVTRRLKVRLREELWEDAGQVDYSATFAFVFGCLAFAARFYAHTPPVASVDVHIGLSGVLGRQLTDNPGQFAGFFQSYVATTAQDLAVSRKVELATLARESGRYSIARALVEELGEFFGFRISDDAYEAHVRYTERFLDVKGDIE